MLAGLGAFVNLSSTLSHQVQHNLLPLTARCYPAFRSPVVNSDTRFVAFKSGATHGATAGSRKLPATPHKDNRLRLRVWAPAWLEHGMSVEFHFSASACLFQLSSSRSSCQICDRLD